MEEEEEQEIVETAAFGHSGDCGVRSVGTRSEQERRRYTRGKIAKFTKYKKEGEERRKEFGQNGLIAPRPEPIAAAKCAI
jgi:hypothetical protein